VIAAAGIFILTRLISRERFARLRWAFVAAAVIFWSILGTVLIQLTWESYYQSFASSGMQNGGNLIVTIPMSAGLALLFHWIALRLPWHPILSVCLLGGVESIIEHLVGIFAWRILEIPMLQGVDPLSVLAFAFPDYMLYWCVVVALGGLLGWGWGRLARRERERN
jgi:hypothetical protein